MKRLDMKRPILICLILSALTSCVVSETDEIFTPSLIPNYNSELNHFDAELVPYLEEAEFILKYSSGVTAIRFIEDEEMEGLKESISGICLSPSNVILLRRSTWDRASEEWRTAIVLHEVGHCDFGKDHTQDEVEAECDGKIMHPRSTCSYKAFIGQSDDHIRKEIKE